MKILKQTIKLGWERKAASRKGNLTIIEKTQEKNPKKVTFAEN